MQKNGSPQSQRVRRWSGGASVAPVLAGCRRDSDREALRRRNQKLCGRASRRARMIAKREGCGAVTTLRGGYRTEKSDRQTELVCANVDTKRTGGTSGTNDVRRRNRNGELPSCGNAQSANAVWSGMVSGLQSEYARARNTAGTKSTYDAWQLHEKPHKEGGE